MAQCNQSATRLLTGRALEWYSIWDSGLVSAVGKFGTQQHLKMGQHWRVKSMSSCPCIISISATTATSLMGPLANDKDGWGDRLTVHKMGHIIYLIIKLLWWSCFDECLHGIQVLSHPLPIQRHLTIYFLSKGLSH